MSSVFKFLGLLLLPVLLPLAAGAETGGLEHQEVRVTEDAPLLVDFDSIVIGGYRDEKSAVEVVSIGTSVLISASGLSPQGELVVIHLANGRKIGLRVLPASEEPTQ